MPSSYEAELLASVAKQELVRRKQAKGSNIDIIKIAGVLPWHKDFFADDWDRIALFGERRGAKTATMAILAVDIAMNEPNSNVLYICQTQDKCNRNMRYGALEMFVRQYHLPAHFVGDKRLVFDNGSVIWLIGLDAHKG